MIISSTGVSSEPQPENQLRKTDPFIRAKQLKKRVKKKKEKKYHLLFHKNVYTFYFVKTISTIKKKIGRGCNLYERVILKQVHVVPIKTKT